jgi:hypothetical protein
MILLFYLYYKKCLRDGSSSKCPARHESHCVFISMTLGWFMNYNPISCFVGSASSVTCCDDVPSCKGSHSRILLQAWKFILLFVCLLGMDE